MNSKLTRADIQYIDAWLKNQGVKFIDIRYELLDHLATEFEAMDNSIDLQRFLKERITWCKTALKEKQKAVNFGMTKALFTKCLGLLTKTKSILILVFVGASLHFLETMFAAKIVKDLLFYAYLSLMLYQIFLMLHSGFDHRIKKESVSVMYLFNLFGLSQLPLYLLQLFPKKWWLIPHFYWPYLGFAIILAFAGVLVFREKRTTLLKDFEALKKEYV